jgi:plastocyanin
VKSGLFTISRRVSVSRVGMALLGGLAIAAVGTSSAAFAAQDQSVTIDSFAFAPADISAPVGSTLTWTNTQAGVPHTTTAINGAWDSGVLSTGNSFSFKLDQVGDFAYECLIHPSMLGTVHVVAAAAEAVPVEALATDTSTTEDASATAPVAVAEPAVAPTLAPTVAPTIAPTAAPTVAPKPAPTPQPAKPTPSSYGY